MPSIHVCPLSCLHETVTSLKASHLITLMNEGAAFSRPPSILDEHYLFIGTNDIIAPLEGYVLPTRAHVESLLNFVHAWDGKSPLVIHCWAGISRSTAAAYIAACALSPSRDEAEIAGELRKASPMATPNSLLVSLADDLLERQGRMVEAIRAIGRGAEAMEGIPFVLQVNKTS